MTQGQIELVPFHDELAADFERLNREWLEKFNLLEEGDLPYLQSPRAHIIDKGGAIFCAVDQRTLVGTVAVIPQSATVAELAKLAVAKSARGRGIGRRLTQAAIDFAAESGAELLVLSSNHQLVEAIRLYESLGFSYTPAPVAGVEYTNADVFMQLRLRRPFGLEDESPNRYQAPSCQGAEGGQGGRRARRLS